MNNPFDINEQCARFLARAHPSGEELSPAQAAQFRIAFAAGFAQSLLTVASEIPKLPDEEATDAVQGMLRQAKEIIVMGGAI